MLQFETKVIGIIDRAPGVKSFRFESKESVLYKPGQFFFVGINIDGEERTKHFSFSSSPTEAGYIEFTKRLTESPYSKALTSLSVGEKVKLKMPYGNFTFLGEYKKIAFLSGGIGITPIRSICKYVFDKKTDTDVVLLYGNNTEKDIIFKEDLDKIAKENIKVLYTLTSSLVDRKAWRGKLGFIDEKMIKDEIPDYKERIFYICGPPLMVKSLTDILKDRCNVKNENIKLENFTGY